MSEEKKDECCGTTKSGCCGGIKKIILGLVLVALIFTCGYAVGKGYCPFSSCHGKICPITQH